MTQMTVAQAAQQNNRTGNGQYATKAVDEANNVDLSADAPAEENFTVAQWEKRAFESMTAEDKDELVRYVLAHGVYLAAKPEWSMDDNFSFSEGTVEKLRGLTEMPPEGAECGSCGVIFEGESVGWDELPCPECREEDEVGDDGSLYVNP